MKTEICKILKLSKTVQDTIFKEITDIKTAYNFILIILVSDRNKEFFEYIEKYRKKLNNEFNKPWEKEKNKKLKI